MDNITFVTYHTDLTDNAVQTVLEKHPVFREIHWDKYLPYSRQCIDLMFKSVKQLHDNARCVLISDTSTPFDQIEGVELLRYDVDPNMPAYMRLKAQIDFLKENNNSHVIFLDYDMLVQKDLSQLFNLDFDIGFSYRLMYNGKFCPCPINGGLMIIPKERAENAAAFLQLVMDTYDKNYPDNKEWGGFQGSISDVIGDDNIFNKTSDIISIHNTRILLLPVEEYNFTIDKTPHLVDYMPDKKILHFKGPRKDDMIDYWNEYLSPRK